MKGVSLPSLISGLKQLNTEQRELLIYYNWTNPSFTDILTGRTCPLSDYDANDL